MRATLLQQVGCPKDRKCWSDHHTAKHSTSMAGKFSEVGHLAKTILYLATTHHSPTIEEQCAACAGPDDFVVEAGRLSFADLAERLVCLGIGLEAGDTLKIYDLVCVNISTSTLIRMLVSILAAGVTVEICGPDVRIVPGDDPGGAIRLLEALDAHWRRIHGIKTKEGAKGKLGRKPRLHDDQLPAIRDMLAKPGATVTTVAGEMHVGRSTLFKFLNQRGVAAKQD